MAGNSLAYGRETGRILGPIFAGNGREMTGNLQADGREKPKTYTGNGRELVRKNSKISAGFSRKLAFGPEPGRSWPIIFDSAAEMAGKGVP